MLENRGEFVTTRIAIALVLISSSTPGAETARPATTDCGMHALFVLFHVRSGSNSLTAPCRRDVPKGP